MSPERWRQIEEIFHAATELPAGHRTAYLTEACAGDTSLLAAVEKLIAAHEQAGSFIEGSPPLDASTPLELDPAEPVAGRRIGAYELIREIGRGGMGAVYLAARADDEFLKRVAIKLVQAGADHEAIVRRFRNERQILACLDHPNIARLLDGGTTESGSPYFVMEYIEGQPLKQYCDSRKLSTVERLRLFQTVCSAVHYAHQNLIVHRDIKPGNILITADGVPKLLDFGIAKLVSPTAPPGEHSERTAQLMTPEYASPEQARYEPITTATDIYSLGVLLYELLTGHRPYHITSSSPVAIVQAICEQEPDKPSVAISRTEPSNASAGGRAEPVTPDTVSQARSSEPHKLRRELQGDLDNIVLKAMQKEPQRRYGSVEQFSEDIRRCLEGRPVIARKDTLAYRAGKFIRRNKAGVAAAALVFVAVALGAAATLWEARVAIEQRARAERRFNDVRKLANSFLFEFDDAIINLPGSTPARALVVKRALEYLDSLAREAQQDRSLQREVATAYDKVGEVQGDPMYPNLGDSHGASATLNKALAIREVLSRAEPENLDVRRELADTYADISDVLAFSGDTASAVQASGKALKIYEGLADRFANNAKFQEDLAGNTYQHASLLRKSGDLDGSLAKYTRAAELSRRLVAANPSDPGGKIHLATSIDGVGGILQEKGDTRGALENRRQALAIREELASDDANNAHYRRQLGFAHHNLGLSLAEAGDVTQALSQFREELSLFESLRAADPKDAQARRNLSLAHKQIGDVLMRTSDWNGVLDHYAKALAIDRESAAADPANAQALQDQSLSEGKYGFVLAKLGKAGEALAILWKGVSSQELLLSKDPNDDLLRGFLANSYTRLAQCLWESQDTKAALDYYRRALEARQSLYVKSPGNTANRSALAECYVNLGKAVSPGNPKEALDDHRKAIELLETLTATDVNNAQHRIRLANALTNAARLHARLASLANEPLQFQREQWSKASSFFQRSRDLWLALEQGGKLVGGDRQWPRVVTRELAACESSRARLNKE